MIWIIIIGVLVIAYVLLVRSFGKRNLRVTATVVIPPAGPASVTFVPSEVSGEDLTRMALTYGSKLRWLLLNEPAEVQGLYKELTAEAVDSWSDGSGPLLHRMPTAARILEELENSNVPAAVSGGEKFSVRYSRTSHQNLLNRSSITNDLPRPGMAVNLAWNYLLLLGAVHDRLDSADREPAGQAYRNWWDAAFQEWAPDRSLAGLSGLIAAADTAWERAAAMVGSLFSRAA